MSLEISQELKLKGNEAFGKNEFKKAAKYYRDAIKLDSSNPVLYSNRAICFIKLQDFERALRDCELGLELSNDSKTTQKLEYRKRMALDGLLTKNLTSKEASADGLQSIEIIEVEVIPPDYRLKDAGYVPITKHQTFEDNSESHNVAKGIKNISIQSLSDPTDDWKEKSFKLF